MHTASRQNGSQVIKVFFDGQCPLCRREISHYQRLRGAENIHWIDISDDPGILSDCGVSLEQTMARLHVLDVDNRWQIGAYGFAEIWNQLPALRWLAVILRKLYLLPFVDHIYTRFADWRFRRRCGDHGCTHTINRN